MERGIQELSLDNWLGALISFLPALVNLFILLYVLTSFPKNATVKVFALFTLALFFWQIDDTLQRLSTGPYPAYVWDTIFCIGWIFVGSLALHFSLLYTGRTKIANSYAMLGLLYVPDIIFTGLYNLVNRPEFYTDMGFWGWINEHNNTLTELLLLNWLALEVTVALFLLCKYVLGNRSYSIKFYQSLIIFIGVSIPGIQGIITQIAFPVFLDLPAVPLTSTFMSFFSIAVLVAFSKYKLFSLSESVDTSELFENLPDLVIHLSENKRVIYLNPAAQKTFNRSSERFHFITLYELVADRKEVRGLEKPITSALEGQPVQNHLCSIYLNGEQRSFLISANPLISNRKVDGVLLVARDITELKKAEEKIRQTEIRFKALIENSHDGVAMMDGNGDIFYASPSIKQVTGFEPEEYLGMNFLENVHPEYRKQVATEFQKLFTHPGECIQLRLLAMHKNGNYVWLEGIGSNLLDNPAVGAIVGNFRNVNEQVLIEQENESNLTLFRSMVKNMESGILIQNEDLSIFSVNQSFFDIFGISQKPEDLIHQDCAILQDITTEGVEDMTAFVQRIAEIWKHRKPVQNELILFSNGKIFERDYVPIHRSTGEFIAHMWQYRDVTARKKSEQLMREQNQQLQKINRELDRFVYSASHDIRSPLTSILGLVDVACLETEDKVQKEYLNMIKRSILKLDDFTPEIINFSRNSRLDIDSNEVVLYDTIHSLVEQIKLYPESDIVSIQIDVNPKLKFSTDQARLNNMLNNLITNAIKYSDPSKESPYVKVSAHSNSHYIFIEVEDNGEGIAEKDQQKIFDMFFRASYKSKGSGLGLYNVKEIADKMEGEVKVVSSPGKGSTFKLKLPDLAKHTLKPSVMAGEPNLN